MRSLLGVNHLLARYRGFPLKYSRYFTVNQVAPKRGRPSKNPKAASEEPPNTVADPEPLDRAGSFVASLNHYSSLPPLPPIDDWLSHFPYASVGLRDRISIRDPLSAIHVAHSFVDGKKTSTENPKVIVEAFPGALMLSSRGFFFYGCPRSWCPLTGIDDPPAV
jgi:hypothetical protein